MNLELANELQSDMTVLTSEPLHILLIIYEWPLGSPQVIRWVNLLRYFVETGHSLTVLSAEFEKVDRPVDESLVRLMDHPNIHQHRVPAPSRDHTSREMLQWSNRATSTARQLATENQFDLVISSALPIGDTIVASRLKSGGLVPCWIADYGDPWSTSRTLGQAWWKKPIFKHIERRLLKHADALTITTETAIKSFTPIYDRHERIFVVKMGASYFHVNKDWPPPRRSIDSLNLLYTGSFYHTRRPDKIFEAICEVDDVQLTIVGNHFIDISPDIARFDIGGRVHMKGQVDQKQIVEMQGETDVLLLTAWPYPEQISGKFFEYIATNKPILYLSNHDRDIASDYIRENNNGYIAKDNPTAIAESLRQIRDDARAGRLKRPQPDRTAGFDQRAQELMRIVEQIRAPQLV